MAVTAFSDEASAFSDGGLHIELRELSADYLLLHRDSFEERVKATELEGDGAQLQLFVNRNQITAADYDGWCSAIRQGLIWGNDYTLEAMCKLTCTEVRLLTNMQLQYANQAPRVMLSTLDFSTEAAMPRVTVYLWLNQAPFGSEHYSTVQLAEEPPCTSGEAEAASTEAGTINDILMLEAAPEPAKPLPQPPPQPQPQPSSSTGDAFDLMRRQASQHGAFAKSKAPTATAKAEAAAETTSKRKKERRRFVSEKFLAVCPWLVLFSILPEGQVCTNRLAGGKTCPGCSSCARICCKMCIACNTKPESNPFYCGCANFNLRATKAHMVVYHPQGQSQMKVFTAVAPVALIFAVSTLAIPTHVIRRRASLAW